MGLEQNQQCLGDLFILQQECVYTAFGGKSLENFFITDLHQDVCEIESYKKFRIRTQNKYNSSKIEKDGLDSTEITSEFNGQIY